MIKRLNKYKKKKENPKKNLVPENNYLTNYQKITPSIE